MPLFSFQVKEDQPYELNLKNSAVWFGSATLVKGEKLTLSVRQEGKKPVNIACLNANWARNVRLNHKLDSEPVIFEGKGSGVVEMVCEKQDFCDVDSDAESGEEEEEEETDVSGEEAPELVEVAKKSLKRAKTQQQEQPAKKQKLSPEEEAAARKQELRRVQEAKAKKEAAEKKKLADEAKAKKEAEEKRQLAEKAKKEAEEQQRLLKQKQQEDKRKQLEAEKNKQKPSGAIKKVLPCGVQVEIYKQGAGQTAKVGKNVKVQYDGRLMNGKRFDKGSISFRLGLGEVIKGWDEGVKGMMVGEKRKLLIPPRLAYGARGAPPDIPRNATLLFDVCLLKA